MYDIVCIRKHHTYYIIHHLRFAHQIDASDEENHAYNEGRSRFTFRYTQPQYRLSIGQESDQSKQNNHYTQDGERCAKKAPKVGIVILHEES